LRASYGWQALLPNSGITGQNLTLLGDIARVLTGEVLPSPGLVLKRFIEFPDERRALAFERYLKSGSGVAFAQRHLR
jgi:hypothetical protein